MTWTPRVIDNPNPVEPEAPSLASRLRLFAAELERGEWGDIERVGLALEYDGGLKVHDLGDFSDLELMGLFSAAHLMVFAGHGED